MRSSVDLPQPDGPTSTVKEPAGISRSSPGITVVPEVYDLRMAERRTSCMVAVLESGGRMGFGSGGGVAHGVSHQPLTPVEAIEAMNARCRLR